VLDLGLSVQVALLLVVVLLLLVLLLREQHVLVGVVDLDGRPIEQERGEDQPDVDQRGDAVTAGENQDRAVAQVLVGRQLVVFELVLRVVAVAAVVLAVIAVLAVVGVIIVVGLFGLVASFRHDLILLLEPRILAAGR
jgi:hypothetical protein